MTLALTVAIAVGIAGIQCRLSATDNDVSSSSPIAAKGFKGSRHRFTKDESIAVLTPPPTGGSRERYSVKRHKMHLCLLEYNIDRRDRRSSHQQHPADIAMQNSLPGTVANQF